MPSQRLRDAVKGFTGYSQTHNWIGLDLSSAALDAAYALEQQAARIQQLEAALKLAEVWLTTIEAKMPGLS